MIQFLRNWGITIGGATALIILYLLAVSLRLLILAVILVILMGVSLSLNSWLIPRTIP